MDRPVDPFALDPPPSGAPPKLPRRDEEVFFQHRVTSIALHYGRPTMIDEAAASALALWFTEHGYDENELKRRTVEVTYRVLPRYGEVE